MNWFCLICRSVSKTALVLVTRKIIMAVQVAILAIALVGCEISPEQVNPRSSVKAAWQQTDDLIIAGLSV
ncbi:MAG TPA: hypothetical protein DCX08_05440 [Porticoccaceae bacterium]|jgi:hypothetical protein|nr:hypothetical protein [Tateyamaria sp.]HAZ79358.1 hypothetical protein [Porticoccaceae bacterium]